MTIHENIKDCLLKAGEMDTLAREYRAQAGRLLAKARNENSSGSNWYKQANIDHRTAELLIEMSIGKY